MKILITRISDGTLGGAEMSAFDQAYVLHSLGHDIMYVSSLPSLRKRARNYGIKTASLPWIQIGQAPLRYILFWLLLPWFVAKALWLVFRYKPDIINPHSREDQIVFTLTKPLHRRPVVWKDAGDLRHLLRTNRTNPFAAIYEKMLHRALRKADFVYLLSKDDVANLCKVFGDEIKERVTNIPSSILYEYYDLDAKPQQRPKDKIIIGYIGRISRLKGSHSIAEAAQKLQRSDVEFWLCGDGDYKNEMIRQTKGQNFRFFAFTNEVSSFLNSFDIFVQPAEHEGWGRNVKEAMYFGLPVVGSNSGGVAAQIDHEKTGLLFAPGDAKSLAEQLLRVINDKKLRGQLGTAAQAKAKKDGDFRTIVEQQILPIYERFI